MTTARDTRPPLDGGLTRTRAIGTAAVILMAGNLTGSLFGFVRLSVITGVYGSTNGTDAFFAASILPQMFYDLVIGAAVGAALIPTFTAALERHGREELSRVAGGVLALAWLVLFGLVVLLELFALPIMELLLWGYHQSPGNMALAVEMARVLVPTLFFLSTSAVLLATLYALRRFTAPAFAPSLYHIGIIAAALAAAGSLGIMALPIGALAGAAAQCAVLVATFYVVGGRLHISLDLGPEMRQILRLYAPVAAGLVVSIVGQVIDISFKSLLPHGSITDMAVATALVQFPIGIAVAALSFAVLRTISSDVTFDRLDEYKDTIAAGIRFVLFLTIPAAVGYLVLGTPIVTLVVQHQHFTPADTANTVRALIGYAIQIPFVGIDQILIFSFYARKDTMTPMLVGVVGVGIYVVSALLLRGPLQILGLALANTIQNSLHALILLVLLFLAIGPLGGRGILRSVAKSLVSAGAMALVAAVLAAGIGTVLNEGSAAGRAADVLVPVAVGAAAYVAAAALLRSPELGLAWRAARRA